MLEARSGVRWVLAGDFRVQVLLQCDGASFAGAPGRWGWLFDVHVVIDFLISFCCAGGGGNQ